MENSNRKDFLKSIGALSLGAGLLTPFFANANSASYIEDELGQYDADGKQVSKATTVSILQTTDVHCQIHPHDEFFWESEKAVFRKTGGYAYLAAMLQNLKKKNPNTFTIDTGDMFQGSALSVKTAGKAFVSILNAMQYDLYLPGNWEVIYGKKNMQTLLGALNAPKVCANMYHDIGEGKQGELIFQPYHIWNVAGAKIGFIGYTDPLVPIRQSPNYSKGIIYTKPEKNLAHYIDVLKNQEQCSFIILLSHLGLSQQLALANKSECEGVDYILGGDTHERVRKPIQCKYAKVVEPGAFGSFIGKLDLTILNGKVIANNYDLLEVACHKIKPNKGIQKLLADNEAAFKEQINTVIGYSTIPLYRYFVVENPIDTLILNALKWQFPYVDIALSNGFRFCPPRTTPDYSGNIPITNGFIYDMLPVDSTVRIAKATGKQLKDWLEKELNNVFAKDASNRLGGWVVKFEGMKVSFKAFAEIGNRVQSITVNGTPLELDKQYSILACERDGDPADMLCRLKGVTDAKNTDFTLHKVLIAYLKNNSPVTPIPAKNAKILDGPDTLLSQVTGVDYVFR
jgi:2',3'-cyclic-nucleotide 2'-phosphodiesterase (5'-nucleotidase family)